MQSVGGGNVERNLAALVQAVDIDNVEWARRVIALGAPLNAMTNTGVYLLHKTAALCTSTMTELLLSSGAIPNVRDLHKGATPLHMAVATEGMHVVRARTVFALIRYGANVNAVDNDGDTPLHYIVRNHLTRLAIVMLEAGADPTVRNKENLSPFDIRDCMCSDRVCAYGVTPRDHSLPKPSTRRLLGFLVPVAVARTRRAVPVLRLAGRKEGTINDAHIAIACRVSVAGRQLATDTRFSANRDNVLYRMVQLAMNLRASLIAMGSDGIFDFVVDGKPLKA